LGKSGVKILNMLEIIENFLPIPEVNKLEKELHSSEFPYYYQDTLTSLIDDERGDDEKTQFFFCHSLYRDGKITSEWAKIADILLLKINSTARRSSFKRTPFNIERAKINCYPRMQKNLKSDRHIDQSYKHIVALYSVNTCNGGTIFHEEEAKNIHTKPKPLFIPSVKNTLILCDGNIPHQSVGQTDTKLRLNINLNLT